MALDLLEEVEIGRGDGMDFALLKDSDPVLVDLNFQAFVGELSLDDMPIHR